MSYTESEAKELLFEAIKTVRDQPTLGEGWLKQNFSSLVRGWRPADYLYVPDRVLISRIEDYEQWCQTQTGEDAGKLMEEIALLAFRCLRGWDSIKSYQSYAPQHDLVISGSDADWETLIEYLHLPWVHRTIVIEAKNLQDKVDDKQFARLCGILQNKFAQTSDLGVFCTRHGATGFPEFADSGQQPQTRQRVLRDAYATQIIFHAQTGKYVVVLNHADIRELTQLGALPRILETRIRAVEECTGLSIEFGEEWKEIDLPKHLMQYIDTSDT